MRRATNQTLLGELGLDGPARTIGVRRHTHQTLFSQQHLMWSEEVMSNVRSIFHRQREHQEIHG